MHALNVHTSVLGVRGVAPNVCCVGADDLEVTAASIPGCEDLRVIFDHDASNIVDCLLAVPLECNFSGRRLPLHRHTFSRLKKRASDMLQTAKDVSGTCLPHDAKSRWWVLADAAKFAGTSPLNLSMFDAGQGPDFVCVSFYKIFGYMISL
jgi:hypothetical protein